MAGTATRESIGSVSTKSAHAKVVELGKLILQMTTASGSGHPSSALAIGHIVHELMYRRMVYDVTNPWHAGNDRLVLSLGHAVPAVYAAYADLGGVVGTSPNDCRPLTIEDLKTLREQDSVLDGHPNPAEGFRFFDAATGSLGQGLSVAAGLALAARRDGIDKRIYCIIGDGESREGQVWEAADFIVDQKLTNICAIFSCNGHGQADSVSPQQSADALVRKLEAFGWDARETDGHDPAALSGALDWAEGCDKPAAIVATTVKGWGVDLMLGKNFHGKPLSKDDCIRACVELDQTASNLGAEAGEPYAPLPPNTRPDRRDGTIGQIASFEDALKHVGLGGALEKKKIATRVAYGAALVALADVDDRIVALDGDVSNSTFANTLQKHHPDRFFECKIAEQSMISAGAGMAAAGQIPFASSFAKFLARAADQIDMAAISRANVKIVGSHSGVSLAADGPSQMAVSDVGFFRTLAHVDSGFGDVACRVFQPSDGVSAYRLCELMARTDGMSYMRTHRPDADFLYDLNESFDLSGWKQLREGDNLTIVSSGYMVHEVLAVADELKASGTEVNVFDAYALPLETGAILDAARKSGGAVLVVEDNYCGGWHAEIAEAAAKAGDVKVEGVLATRMPKSAKSATEVFDYVGVGRAEIAAAAKRLAYA